MKRRGAAFIAVALVAALAPAGTAVAASTRTWTGNGSTDKWSNAANWEGGTVPEAGDDIVLGGNAVSTNDLDTTTFRSVVLNGHGVNRPVRVAERIVSPYPGGGCLCSGVRMASPVLVTDIAAFTAVHGIDGGGTGTVVARGPGGTLLLPVNTTADIGRLEVDGGNVAIEGTVTGKTIVTNDGALGGTGHLPDVEVRAGRLYPGNINGLGGVLRTDRLSMDAASTFGVYLGEEHPSTLMADGPDLGGAHLSVQLPSPMATSLPVGNQYRIIDNPGAGAVRGTFGDLVEGAELFAWGHVLRITYRGGDGNDVVLTVARHQARPNIRLEVPTSVHEGDGSFAVRIVFDELPGLVQSVRLGYQQVNVPAFSRAYDYRVPLGDDGRPERIGDLLNLTAEMYLQGSSNQWEEAAHTQVHVIDDDFGYRMVAADGGVFNFGGSEFWGAATGGKPPRAVAIANTVDGNGYWIVHADGGYRRVGFADDFGPGPSRPTRGGAPIVGAIDRGHRLSGFWEVGADGAVYPVGNAPDLGSVSGPLNQPIVAMTTSPGDGYWLVASDGGIFTFGDAPFLGSTGDIKLNKPIVGMAATPSGAGYWLVASDGGIFTFGDAPFLGSTGDIRLNKPVVGMLPTPTGDGYWLVASDGGIFTFGDAPFLGSTGHLKLAAPITAISA
jgi:hypothetical protein